MTHGEFIEKYNKWRPLYESFKAGKTTKDEIAESAGVLKVVVSTMFRFVENNSTVPHCDWLADFPNASIGNISNHIDLTSLANMRKTLIDKFQVNPVGPFKHFPKLINAGVLRRVLEKSGLKCYDRDGRPCVHWNQKP